MKMGAGTGKRVRTAGGVTNGDGEGVRKKDMWREEASDKRRLMGPLAYKNCSNRRFW